MALNARIHANNPSNAASTPHVLGHEAPRTQGGDKLLDVRNGTTEATSKFSVDKDGLAAAAALKLTGTAEVEGLRVNQGTKLVRVSKMNQTVSPAPGWSNHGFSFPLAQVGDLILVSAARNGVIANGYVHASEAVALNIYRDSGSDAITFHLVLLRFT